MIEFLKEFTSFLVNRKKFWLIPILLSIAVFGGLLLLAEGTAVAPFIYSLF